MGSWCIQPTYEELKPWADYRTIPVFLRIQPTYEELKPDTVSH